MSKQTINVGETANDRQGDSLRSAFQKVNANFTELYTALGLDTAPLNLGAFTFTDSVIGTEDSTSIVIDRPTTINGELSVDGDITPKTDLGSSLGTPDKRFQDLYLSGNTIFLGTTRLSVDEQGNLLVGGQAVADVGTAAWNNIIGKPTFAAIAETGDYSDLINPPTLSAVASSGDYDDLSNKPTIPTVPTVVSQLTNDSNFIVLQDVIDAGFLTAADIAGGTLTIDVNNTGDLKGSVFGDDSAMLVDATNSKLVGDVENAAINTRAIRSSDTGTGNLLLQGSSTSAGDGGSITIWGGSGFGTGNGGVVTIDAGNASGSGTKGVINIGTSTTGTGSVTIGLPLQSSIIVSNDDDSVTINGNVDFTNATVSGLSVSAQGFTYSELEGTSEIGVTADVFDFGDGKTIDMQNSNVLFTGSTVSGILSLNTDYITIGVGGSINMQGSDIGAAGTVSAVTVNAIDFNGNLSGTVDGDLTGSVFADDSTLLVDGVNGKIVAPININDNEIFDGAGDTGLNIRSNQTDGNIYLYSYGSDGDGTGAGNIYVTGNGVDIYGDWRNGGVDEYKWSFGGDGTLTVPGDGKIASPATGNLEFDVGRDNGGAFIVTAWEDRNDPEGGWKQILWGYDGSKYDFFVGGDITAQGTINTTNISHPSNDGLGLRLNSTDKSTLMVAKQSFNRTFDEDATGYNFSMLNTPNRVRVTFDANNGLYLKGLIERWTVLYENIGLGDPYSFEFDYSNIRLSLEPDAYDIVTNVVNVTQFDELIWDIEIDQDPIAVLAAAGKAPGVLDQIALRYDYNNTAGFDIGRNRYGMSVDHEDIDIRAGRDVDLEATDDFRVRAGSAFSLNLDRNDDQAPDEGISINLWNNANTALQDVKSWVFGFDGNLYLPDGGDLISTNDINITVNNFDSTTHSWNFGNDGTLRLPASSLNSNIGMIWSPADSSIWLSGTTVDKTTDGNGVVLNGGQNEGTGRGGGISIFGGLSTGGQGGDLFFVAGYGSGGTDNGNIYIGQQTTKNVEIGGLNTTTVLRGIVDLADANLTSNDDITITVANDDSTTYAWNFSNTGDLTIPGNIESDGSIQLVSNASTVQIRGTNAFGSITYDDSDGDILIATTGTITMMGAAGSAVNIGGGTSGNITLGNGSNQTTINGNLTVAGDITRAGTDGEDLIIAAAENTSIGGGGILYLRGGAGVGNFGNVRIADTGSSVFIGKTDGTGDDIQTYSRLQIHRGVVEDYAAKADATGVVEHDCDAGHLFYHTSPDANWTVNLTNLNAYATMSTNIVIVIEQGGTPYYPNALQIGGAAQTIKWLGNVTPTPQANKTEIATFTIFYNGSNYNVLGSYSSYG